MKLSDWQIKNYSPLGMSVDEILNQNDVSNDRKFESLFYRIDLKPSMNHKPGYESFTDTERKIREIWIVFGEVGNGGFDQYFCNSSGDCAEIVLAGLKEIGADDAAVIMLRAMSIFPDGDPFGDEGQLLEELAYDSYHLLEECDKEFIGLQDK